MDATLKTKHAAIIDMTGERYTRLVVTSFHSSNKAGSRWHCRCDCGTAVVVSRESMVRGRTKSCGCIRKEMYEGMKNKSVNPYRNCVCGGIYRRLWSKNLRGGGHRKKYECEDCHNVMFRVFESRTGVELSPEYVPAPVPAFESPACPWFSTLPVAGCVSLR